MCYVQEVVKKMITRTVPANSEFSDIYFCMHDFNGIKATTELYNFLWNFSIKMLSRK